MNYKYKILLFIDALIAIFSFGIIGASFADSYRLKKILSNEQLEQIPNIFYKNNLFYICHNFIDGILKFISFILKVLQLTKLEKYISVIRLDFLFFKLKYGSDYKKRVLRCFSFINCAKN